MGIATEVAPIRIGVLIDFVIPEPSFWDILIGQSYLASFRDACTLEQIQIIAEESIAQSGVKATEVVRAMRAKEAEAIVHLRFGLGVVRISEALEKLDWDPPRYQGTSWESGQIHDEIMQANLGWIGLEQYDESSLVGRTFLDRFEQEVGRRPEYVTDLHARRRALVCGRAVTDRAAVAAGRHGGARASEDVTGGLWRAGHADLVRQVDAARVDGGGLPGCARGDRRPAGQRAARSARAAGRGPALRPIESAALMARSAS